MITRKFLFVAEAVFNMQSGVDIECDRPRMSDVGLHWQACQDFLFAHATKANLAIGKHLKHRQPRQWIGDQGPFPSRQTLLALSSARFLW